MSNVVQSYARSAVKQKNWRVVLVVQVGKTARHECLRDHDGQQRDNNMRA